MKKLYIGLFVLFCFLSVGVMDVMAKDVKIMVSSRQYPHKPTFQIHIMDIKDDTTFKELQAFVDDKFNPVPPQLVTKTPDSTVITEDNWITVRAYLLKDIPGTPKIEGHVNL